MKFPVLEMFTSIQGEGMYTGCPSLFVRLGGCNLRCVFGNTRCDTPYSSFDHEKPKWNDTAEAAKAATELLKQNPGVTHIVITGGEPMLYKNAIRVFLDEIGETDKHIQITIETNGTLPCDNMRWKTDIEYDEDGNEESWMDTWVDLFSISPKLSTSVDKDLKFLTQEQMEHHDKTRINIKNLASYIIESKNIFKYIQKAVEEYGAEYIDDFIKDQPVPAYQFKFVYSNEDSVKEIKELLPLIAEEAGVELDELNNHVMLMPEGTHPEHLEKISMECAEICVREGWRFCDRLHIRIWGDKRGV